MKTYHVDSPTRIILFGRLNITGTCIASMDFLRTNQQTLYLNGVGNSRMNIYAFGWYILGKVMKEVCRDDYVCNEDWL